MIFTMNLKFALKIMLPIFAINSSAAVVIAGGFDFFLDDPDNPLGFPLPPIDTDLWVIEAFIDPALIDPTFVEVGTGIWGFTPSDIDTFSDAQLFNTDPIKVSQTDPLSQLTLNNLFPGLPVGTNQIGDSISDFDIPDSGSSYFSIAIGVGVSEFPQLGWIEIANNGGVLTSLGSAVAVGEQGIIVGTTTAIPEASTISLTCLIAAVFINRRKRNC